MTARSRPTGRERPPIRIAAALTGCLVLGAAACGGDSEPAPTTDRPPATTADTAAPGTTAGTTAVSDEEAAVLETVERYWDTWLAANNPPNPDHPDLERYATGANLEKQRASIADNKSKGIVIVESDTSTVGGHSLDVISIEGPRALVRDCFVDDLVQRDAASGAPVDQSIATELLTLHLLRSDVGWQVESNEREERWTDVYDCSAS